MKNPELITGRFKRNIAGVLNCFDRLVFSGTYKPIFYPQAMSWHIHEARIRLVDYEMKFAIAPQKSAKFTKKSGHIIQSIVGWMVAYQKIFYQVLRQFLRNLGFQEFLPGEEKVT